MNESNLISDGVLLMLIGMGTVFVFLSILVFCTSMLEKLVSTDVLPNTAKVAPTSDDEVAAVTAAVYTYRKNQLNNKE